MNVFYSDLELESIQNYSSQYNVQLQRANIRRRLELQYRYNEQAISVNQHRFRLNVY